MERGVGAPTAIVLVDRPGWAAEAGSFAAEDTSAGTYIWRVTRLRPAFLLALVCAACGSPQPPPVVLIVLDTIRADHLSCYGYARPTSPNLDRFAAQADLYRLARSTAPWTLPSHASLFTGKFPHEHGAESRATPEGVTDGWPLAQDEVTLAEALAGEGYRTGAFAANFAYVNARYQLDQGFATFSSEKRRAPEINAAALAWLDAPPADPKAAGAPFLLFLNYMDAHRRYNVAPLPPGRAEELPAPPARDVGELLDELVSAVLAQEAPPPPELVQGAIDAYDLGIANLDRALGELFDELRRRGLYDQALIVVTSDHGEYFGEHDLVEHSKDVYEVALRIPLLIKRPGQRAGRVLDDPLTIADVPRLVLEQLSDELRELAPRFPGSSGDRGRLAELRYTRPKDLAAPYGERFRRERSVLYAGRWKLIRSSDGAHELYDLEKDPTESHNLFADQPEEARKLLLRLKSLTLARRRYDGDPPPEPLTADELRALDELGY
jgi:arylsulfatase A-like enzyme